MVNTEPDCYLMANDETRERAFVDASARAEYEAKGWRLARALCEEDEWPEDYDEEE
jgi:hypothetical protein